MRPTRKLMHIEEARLHDFSSPFQSNRSTIRAVKFYRLPEEHVPPRERNTP